jgi:hypothetical protein
MWAESLFVSNVASPDGCVCGFDVFCVGVGRNDYHLLTRLYACAVGVLAAVLLAVRVVLRAPTARAGDEVG